MRLVAMFTVLFGFWLLLSGHYTPFLTISGALAALMIAFLGFRVGYLDDEGIPVDRIPAGLRYWPWLVKEMAKSALDVTKIVLDPRLPISPRLFRTRFSQETDIGVVTYASSITLTPGTITAVYDREDREFVVHALTEAGAEGVREGGMDRRVKAFEGPAPPKQPATGRGRA
jgi:multicomponent Na+:H+ antiporter subunit E